MVVHDAVEANDFARHLKARDLVAPVFGGDTGFEKPCANRVERGKGFAVVKQRAAPLDLAAHGNDVVDALQLVVVQANGHAQLAQVAVGAGDFDGERVHGHSS
ncbi:hypothetical protein D3C72_2172110 [compost metagenome]